MCSSFFIENVETVSLFSFFTLTSFSSRLSLHFLQKKRKKIQCLPRQISNKINKTEKNLKFFKLHTKHYV